MFPQKPFERNGSIDLLMAAKYGDYNKARLLLLTHGRYLVYDFNEVRKFIMKISSIFYSYGKLLCIVQLMEAMLK